MYTQKIMQHFLNPQNAGSIKKPDVTGKFVDEKNGEIVKVYLKINLESNFIENATFKTLGSPVAIACSDIACETIKGKYFEEVEQISKLDILNFVGKENIPSEKLFSLSTIEEAIKNAIKVFRKKYL